MKAGDRLYTGKIVTKAEAAWYDDMSAWVDEYKTAHPVIVSGSLVERELEFRLNQRHRLFESIALQEV